MVAAKPLAAGLPLGAIIAREPVAAALGTGMHGTTFGGGPLACRVALEFLDILEQEKLLKNVRRVGAYFQRRLRQLQRRFPFIKALRGRGLMLAADLEFDARPIVREAMQAGLLLNSTHDTVLRFLPPYIIGEEHVDRALAILSAFLRGDASANTQDQPEDGWKTPTSNTSLNTGARTQVGAGLCARPHRRNSLLLDSPGRPLRAGLVRASNARPASSGWRLAASG